jgi:hypothetical protein
MLCGMKLQIKSQTKPQHFTFCEWSEIWLGDFNAKVGTNDIFKLTIENKSLHETGNNNVVRIINFTI